MLRQFGVPRPLAPMRPMLGVSNADAPFIQMKPARSARDIGLAILQAASASHPYYNMLPQAFDVMHPAPAGARKERRFWPSITSEEEESQSDRDRRRHKRRDKDRQRRRTVSAPATKHRRSSSRTRRRKDSSRKSSSDQASDTLENTTSDETSHEGLGKVREASRKGKGRSKGHSDHRRSRSQPSSPKQEQRDRHRKRHSVVYSPLFPAQPHTIQSLPGGVVYFRDIPPNIPISHFTAQPQHEASNVLPLRPQQPPIQEASRVPAILKLPHPSLHSAKDQSYQSHTALHLPLSHAQVAGKACPYIRGQAVSQPLPDPSVPHGTAARIDAHNELVADVPKNTRAIAAHETSIHPVASSAILPKVPDESENLSTGDRKSLLPASDRKGEALQHEAADSQSDGRSLLERAAIVKSSRTVQLWRNKLADFEQEMPPEAHWSFSNRAWHTGILHARNETRLGHLRLTYKHRGDDEVTCFKLDHKKPMKSSVIDDIKAVRSAFKAEMHVAEVPFLPALFRFEWVQGTDLESDRMEREVTDLLVLGRIKRGRSYITRHHYRKRTLMVFEGFEDPDAAAIEAKDLSRSWQWPLREPPNFARWASNADKLEVAFRPSHPDCEIYVINACNC